MRPVSRNPLFNKPRQFRGQRFYNLASRRRFAGRSLPGVSRTNAEKKNISIASVKRVTGQRSSVVVLDYVAAAPLDEDPPLLEIVMADVGDHISPRGNG